MITACPDYSPRCQTDRCTSDDCFVSESHFGVYPLLNFDYCAFGALWWIKSVHPGHHFGQCIEREDMITLPGS